MLSEKEVAFLEANEDWNISVDDLKGETQLVAFSPIFGTWDGTFELEVKDFEDLCQQLFSYWQAFDPDEETHYGLALMGMVKMVPRIALETSWVRWTSMSKNLNVWFGFVRMLPVCRFTIGIDSIEFYLFRNFFKGVTGKMKMSKKSILVHLHLDALPH